MSVLNTPADDAILHALGEHPAGMTTDELVDYTGYSVDSVAPRLRPLCTRGLVSDASRRHVSDGDRPAVVWTYVPTEARP